MLYFKTYATFTNCEIVGTGVMFGRAAAKNSAASYTFTGCTIIGLNAADNFTVGKIYLKGANKVSGSYTGCIIDTSVPVFAPVMNNGVGPVVSYSCQYIDDYVISGGAWTAWEPKTATGTATINIATYASAEDCLADGFTAVNFLKPDGSVYATDYYYPGSTLVTLPEANFPGVVPSGDNWTGTGYGAWANAEVGVTVVTEGMTISPATVTVGYVSGMLADLTLADLVVFNIYIPAYAGEGFEYVGMDTTLKNGSGYAATCATTTIGGKLYYAVSVKVAAYDLAAFTTKINYKIDGVDYSADITFDIFRYVDAVLALEEYACGSEASKLLLNLLQYKREAYVYKFKIVDQKNFVQATLDMIDDYINTKHGDDCKCAADLDTIDIPEWTSAKHGTLEGVVTASQYTLNGGTPTLLIYVNQEIAPNVANVEVRYRRVIQDGEVVYLTDAWSYAEGTITKRNDGYRYDVRGVSMHMQACMAKITITLTDGTIYEGFYSLGEYCNATMTENGWTASEEMYNYCQRVAKALYATSIAAFDYKTSPAN